MYEVVFDEVALQWLEKQEKNIRKRIFEKVVSTKRNPHHLFERLGGRKDFKLRIGNYRVIANIDERGKPIQVTVIGHRKNIYRR